MSLQSLEVRDFRCIEHARLEFDPRFTLITGPNASGKTSLLEAIFFLSCGRSFRSPRLDPLIRTGAAAFTLVGQVQDPSSNTLTLGVRGTGLGSEARLAGQPARGFAAMAAALPVQIIDPEVHRLLEDGPAHRRRYIDWGVFHVEHGFVDAWRRYQRALMQRNAALRKKRPRPEIQLWDHDLLEFGKLVTAQRQQYLAAVAPYIQQFGHQLLGLDVQANLRQGWSADKEFDAALEDSWSKDLQYGLTSVGPHRADVVVRVDGMLAKERVSRGQQKLLASTLLLAQIQHRATVEATLTSLLLDDPAAELDVDNLQRLLAVISTVPAQLIVTALDNTRLNLDLAGPLFHVEQGKVAPMLYSQTS